MPVRVFHLFRSDDVTCVSGGGVVAEGAIFSNGKVAMCWLTDPGSVALYESIQDVEDIHGHGRKSVVMVKPKNGLEDWELVDGGGHGQD